MSYIKTKLGYQIWSWLATWNDYGRTDWLHELEYPELTLNQLNKFNN